MLDAILQILCATSLHLDPSLKWQA